MIGKMTHEPLILDARVDFGCAAQAGLSDNAWPMSLPAVQQLEALKFHPKVTYLVGENGTGKSTLIEALAMACGFNPEGGTRHTRFSTADATSRLGHCVRVARRQHALDGFFLRAESFFNLATKIDELNQGDSRMLDAYGGTSLHEMSHGQSFLAVILNRFSEGGLFFLDEPEAALSLQSSLALIRTIHDLVEVGSQFVIATHSPIVLAYPDAWIYRCSDDGLERVEYEEAEQVTLTRSFLNDRERFLRHLLSDDD